MIEQPMPKEQLDDIAWVTGRVRCRYLQMNPSNA